MIPWWAWLLIGIVSGSFGGGLIAAAATLIYIGKGMFG